MIVTDVAISCSRPNNIVDHVLNTDMSRTRRRIPQVHLFQSACIYHRASFVGFSFKMLMLQSYGWTVTTLMMGSRSGIPSREKEEKRSPVEHGTKINAKSTGQGSILMNCRRSVQLLLVKTSTGKLQMIVCGLKTGHLSGSYHYFRGRCPVKLI
jgi:hypothetical protein